MKLQTINLSLVLLVLFSVPVAGYFCFAFLKNSAVNQSHEEHKRDVEIIAERIDSKLSEHQLSVKELAMFYTLQQVLLMKDSETLAEANGTLDHNQDVLKVSVIYLMDSNGTVMIVTEL
jgi:C4-dicarboxylate-specific signal transduction histidine kinase